MTPLFDFLGDGLLSAIFRICGIALLIGLLLVVYRAWSVLGQLRNFLSYLLLNRAMIKDVLTEFRKFCITFSRPEDE